MRFFPILILSLLSGIVPAAAQSPGPPPGAAALVAAQPVLGVWANPKRTIAVRTALCGDALCGSIVAATAKAQQDARDAGAPPLIGTQLLQQYHRSESGRWSGTVFVPDMGRSFASHIVQLSPNVLRISGCIMGGLICKSQDWTRL